MRVGRDLNHNNASLIAAGLAMYALLSIFPALTAAVSLYGLFVNPMVLVRQIGGFGKLMPPGVWQLFQLQLQDMASHRQAALTGAAVISIAVALWSARSAMASLMTATNVAYHEREKRGFFMQVGLSLLFTIGALIGFLLMLALTVAVPALLRILGTQPWVRVLTDVARWALLWFIAAVALAVIYRFAPAREPARWRWISWGSAIAATLWLAGTVLFSLYVRTLAHYQKTYGPLWDVVVLLMWFYLSSFLGCWGPRSIAKQNVRPAGIRRRAPSFLWGGEEPLRQTRSVRRRRNPSPEPSLATLLASELRAGFARWNERAPVQGIRQTDGRFPLRSTR